MSEITLGHPILLTIVSCLFLLAALWSLAYVRYRGQNYFMDPQDILQGPSDPRAWRLQGRTFSPLMERYFDIAKTVIGLDAGSITLLAGFLGYAAKSGTYFVSVQQVIRIPVFLFCFSILYFVVLLLNLSLDYEEYLVDPTSYSASKYALNMALGISGLICFIAGYFWLAAKVVTLASS